MHMSKLTKLYIKKQIYYKQILMWIKKQKFKLLVFKNTGKFNYILYQLILPSKH